MGGVNVRGDCARPCCKGPLYCWGIGGTGGIDGGGMPLPVGLRSPFRVGPRPAAAS